MAHPARHQIENRSAWRQDLTVEIGNRRNRCGVDLPCAGELGAGRRLDRRIGMRRCDHRKERHIPSPTCLAWRWGLLEGRSIADWLKLSLCWSFMPLRILAA